MMTFETNGCSQEPGATAHQSGSAWSHEPVADRIDEPLLELIVRVSRLRYLSDADAPEIVVRNERRLIRAAVDDLLDTA